VLRAGNRADLTGPVITVLRDVAVLRMSLCCGCHCAADVTVLRMSLCCGPEAVYGQAVLGAGPQQHSAPACSSELNRYWPTERSQRSIIMNDALLSHRGCGSGRLGIAPEPAPRPVFPRRTNCYFSHILTPMPTT